MKTLKVHHFIIAFSLFLVSCAPINYLGDQYAPTSKVDVYYDAKDIKQDYKVIGHISFPYSNDSNLIKEQVANKAKTVGGDAVIILQTTGREDKETVRADVVKYK